jgi:hypothetical protein
VPLVAKSPGHSRESSQQLLQDKCPVVIVLFQRLESFRELRKRAILVYVVDSVRRVINELNDLLGGHDQSGSKQIYLLSLVVLVCDTFTQIYCFLRSLLTRSLRTLIRSRRRFDGRWAKLCCITVGDSSYE